MRLHLVTAAVAGSLALSAFLLGCSTTVDSGISPPPGCSVESNPSLSCTQGATLFACDPGTNPENLDTSLSCSIPVVDSAGTGHYCCFRFTGSQSTCMADDTITCDASSFGYACVPGDDPTSLDPSLNCSSPTQNGGEDDFCCN